MIITLTDAEARALRQILEQADERREDIAEEMAHSSYYEEADKRQAKIDHPIQDALAQRLYAELPI